jgi:tRNA-splicing endonuclease subunit Sen54
VPFTPGCTRSRLCSHGYLIPCSTSTVRDDGDWKLQSHRGGLYWHSAVGPVTVILISFELWRAQILLVADRSSLGLLFSDQVFSALQIIPAGHDIPLRRDRHNSLSERNNGSPSPYDVFWHVYKPVTKVRKTQPPEPDFRLVVVKSVGPRKIASIRCKIGNGSWPNFGCSAQTTPVPDLYRFAQLFGTIPLGPRIPALPSSSQNGLAILRSLFRHLPFSMLGLGGSRASLPPIRRVPYGRLKAGRRNAVFAVVDSGTISFVRFGEGEFGELPLLGEVPST